MPTQTHQAKLIIDGELRDAASGAVFDSIDPSNEEVCGTAADASAKDVTDAIAAARQAFDDGPWPRMTPRQRSDALVRYRDILAQHKDELEDLSTAELGMTLAIRAESVDRAIEHATWYAEHAAEPDLEPLPPIAQRDGTVFGSFVLREPVGVVSAITPYNMPLVLGVGKVFPALATGNTVILKSSPYTPLITGMLGRLSLEADIPAGVINVVSGLSPQIGELMVSDPRVDMVSFTGSTTVGKSILAACAPQVKRAIVELGGKSPSIVLPDVDFDVAIPGLLYPWMYQAGQACIAMARILVPEAIYSPFIERLTEAVAGLRVGDPRDPATEVPPVISDAARMRAEKFIESATADGGHVAAGGKRPKKLERGFYLEPTLIVDTTNDMYINQEEIFGPVCTTIRYSGDPDEAIVIANNSKYGLNATLWTRDRREGLQLARRIRSGQVGINGFTFGAWAPVAGYKESGLGRERGKYGLDQYTEVKHLHWR